MRSVSRVSKWVLILARAAAMIACISAVGIGFTQTNSSSISGNVIDSTGAVISGATVTATQAQEKLSYTAVTDGHGHYSFPDIVPGSYTLTVTSPGFKKDVQTNLEVAATTKVSATDITLSIGATDETVVVSAEGQQVQLENTERVANISKQELLDLPIDSGSSSGRSYFGAVALTPGLLTYEPSTLTLNVNGGQQHQNNLTMDGILNVDAGGNGGQLIDLNADNVGEMHISTNNGGAEYGRQGTTIAVSTASGTSQYHGELTWFHRHEDLNANSWANKRTPTRTPRSRSRLNEFSGNFSGPVAIPHLFERYRNKMFFFAGEDVQQPLLSTGNKNINLPTYAESLGDFSQSVDKNGKRLYLTDYTASGTGTCTPANTVSNPGRCFVGISPVTGQTAINVISLSKQSPIGQKILAIYKNYIPIAGYLGYPSAGVYGTLGQAQPNQNGYNYSNAVSPSENYRQDIYRVDFNPTPTLQTHVRWANLVYTTTTYYGATFSDQNNMPTTPFAVDTPGHGLAIGVTKLINSKTTNEFTVGFNVGKINGAPTTNNLTKTALGISNIPLIYPSSVQDQPPDLEFGGNNLANSPQIVTNDAPYRNANTAIDILDNFTKILGRHQVQAGIQYERLRKDQYNAGTPGGVYQFGDDVNNPQDTSDAYANALTGVFDTFSQQSAWKDGKYRYGDFDFYGQDTWKATTRLTIIGGLRVQHWSPWYDASLSSTNFDPTQWSASAAPRLYHPTATGSTDLGNPGSIFPKAYAGLLVAGSGNFNNGMVGQAGSKYTNNLGGTLPTTSKYLFTTKQWLYSPHLGFTYDLLGNQQSVLRMGAGTFYDRYNGNTVFNMLNNPPSVYNPTVYYGSFAGLSGTSGLIGPPSLLSVTNGMRFPVTYQFNAEVQQQLWYHSILSISYVGSRASHLEQEINLNYSPYGQTFLPQNQNPTGISKIPGANAYTSVLLNTYQGYSALNMYRSGASDNFNSLQVVASRKYARGLFVQLSYNWGKTLGTTSSETNGIDFLGRTRSLLYAPTSFSRLNTFTASYNYTFPSLFNNAVLHGVLDGWQISGITNLWSGNPISFGQTVYSPGTTTTLNSANLTGSYTEGARVQLVGNPFAGAAKNGPYNRLNPAAFQASPQGSLANPYTGLGMRPNQFWGPGINSTDMSLQKSFALHSDRYKLQLRADAFNVFNHVSYTGYNTTVTFTGGPNSIGSTADTQNVASPTNTGGFGGVSGTTSPRVVALMARFWF